MRVVTELPRRVVAIENVWIPMPDGARLAARVWMPADAEAAPVPAILEYIPYRKRDGTRWRDEPMHRYFAGHGYAAVRIDVRGSGESDGVLLDEYTPGEQDDAEAAIAWVAAQPWCTGAVGMIGNSWGGFSALQAAARRPPALGAVIAVCASDDRYADDAHYMGGCLLNENLLWGSSLLATAALPPDPDLVGGRWRGMWRERLEGVPFFPATWLRHPGRDAYWRQGSVCEEYSRIACPVYAVGGWADAYTNGVLRLLAGLSTPRRGLIGPWAHRYPHQGVPGPAIGFLQEALGWWDRWLKGTGAGASPPALQPRLVAWMQESLPPADFHAERPGRWVTEAAWPSAGIVPLRLGLAPGRLVTGEGEHARLEVATPQTVGLAAGAWCNFGGPAEGPADQRPDDRRSLTFDSDPLAERLELLGRPELELEVTSDRPAAFLAVRLCDVDPAGASALVSYGLLNLAHRDGHDAPAPLAPGARYRVRIPLRPAGHAFPAGHRLRLALSTTWWPVAWPSPEAALLTVFTGSGALVLPRRPPRPEDCEPTAFGVPEGGPPLPRTDLTPGGTWQKLYRDPESGRTVLAAAHDFAGREEGEDPGEAWAGAEPSLTRLDDIGLEVGHGIRERYAIADGDPLSAEAVIRHHLVCRRAGWRIRVEVWARQTATRESFHLEGSLEAREGERDALSRRWDLAIPRRLV